MDSKVFETMPPSHLAGIAAIALFGDGLGTRPSLRRRPQPLLQKYCIACATGTVIAPLDKAGLGFDLGDAATYRSWVRAA